MYELKIGCNQCDNVWVVTEGEGGAIDCPECGSDDFFEIDRECNHSMMQYQGSNKYGNFARCLCCGEEFND